MKKILIVEDDNILQQTLKQALEGAGFSVVQVSDGNKAYKKAKQEKPDLILLDLLLPNKHGRIILREIKQDNELDNIPIYIFTVVDNEANMAECLSLGAKGYFLKSDYTLEDIVDKVQKELKQRKY